jgi:hypothetical protein
LGEFLGEKTSPAARNGLGFVALSPTPLPELGEAHFSTFLMKGRLVRGVKSNVASKVIQSSENMSADPSDNEDDEVVPLAISKNFFDFENIGVDEQDDLDDTED